MDGTAPCRSEGLLCKARAVSAEPQDAGSAMESRKTMYTTSYDVIR
ncbi:MAG: hypothetical protein AB7E48_07395 [Deferribacterales bacterium]